MKIDSQTPFTTPSTGYYIVAAETMHYTPTGEFEEVPNPHRHWWEFWEPKTIAREKYAMSYVSDAREIRLLKEGDIVRGVLQKL